jgi:hypothetical protein
VSDDRKKQPRPVGYKQPPVEHQFPKGKSGNPLGRPPKQERSITLRQSRRDLLNILEAPIAITIDGRRTMVSGIEAIQMRMLRLAMSGNGATLRFLYREHKKAVEEHAKDGDFGFLEMAELERIRKPVPPANEKFEITFLNGLRKRTRRI